MRCGCPDRHQRPVHLAPSDPNYGTNLRHWLGRLDFTALLRVEGSDPDHLEAQLDRVMEELVRLGVEDPCHRRDAEHGRSGDLRYRRRGVA